MVCDVKCSGELAGDVVGQLSEVRNQVLAFCLKGLRLVSRMLDVRYIKVTSMASFPPILLAIYNQKRKHTLLLQRCP